MKRRIWTLLAALLLLLPLAAVSCRPKDASASVEEVAGTVRDALAAREFRRADDDFLAANIAEADTVAEGVVYLSESESEIREFGVLRPAEGVTASDLEEVIRDYLDGEAEALQALAALYPGETLADNLARYRAATVERRGGLLCYFVLDESEKSAVRASLRK